MGKISDALERQKKEKSIKVEMLPRKTPERLIPEEPEIDLAREMAVGHKYSPKLVVLTAPDSVDAENFRLLRAQILFPKDGKRPRTIMISSAYPGEGKTFVAANLAVSIALGINEYVLLIDCDLRRPHLHEILGYSNNEGLHDYLDGRKPLQDLIIKTSVEKLSLLTAGRPSPNPSELLSSNRMREFLEEVKGRYQDRFVIMDGTPSQVASESGVLANFVDGIIFTVRAHRSPRGAIKKSVESLGKEKILGVVFNGYDQARKNYYKYYDKYYKKK